MHHIEKLPQFDVQQLLETALSKLDATDLADPHAGIVEAARSEIARLIAVQLNRGEPPRENAEQTLRKVARSLVVINHPNVESARLAIMSAADMLRVA